MRVLNASKILILSSLGLLFVSAFIPPSSTINVRPVMASYNPAPANYFHAPLSSMALVAVTGARPNVQASTSSTSQSAGDQSSLKTIKQNALRFINDSSYFPQSETSIAVDPRDPSHVVGGFNDAKYFFCPILPTDCGGSVSVSLSGFTISTDGGRTVAKSSDLPDLNGTTLTTWGDPSVAVGVDGSFFYASLAINPFNPIHGNGVMIAKSNSNLFDPNISCVTSKSNMFSNPCWKTLFVYGGVNPPVYTFEDKDRMAVDRDPSSPYYGSVYVGWDHFSADGHSSSFLSRCDRDLVSCTMVSGGSAPVVSGIDQFVAWTTPVVGKSGNVYVAWCNFGTDATLGPVNCRIVSSPPGGTSFGAPSNILSYMGRGTTMPMDSVVIGWSTEQFRVGPGLFSIAVDSSSKSSNLYFSTIVCASGHYYQFPRAVADVAEDNPGNCGQSAVLFAESTNGGLSWSSPATLSNPAVNDQPFVTVDSLTGTVCVVYYTSQYDPFSHRIDVVASISSNGGQTFHRQRVTSVSDEPDADPNMFAYITGFGGAFTVPQYGDYFEAVARGGTMWVLFTGNYAVEAGTFQTDPFLAVVQES